ATKRTKRLRERADDQYVVAGRSWGTEHGVCLVEHQQRSVATAQRRELFDRRDIAVHREHGVGYDDGATGPRQPRVEVIAVGVAVPPTPRPCELRAVDDRRVVELVTEHGRVWLDTKRAEITEVVAIAGG